jgi:16S rRNA processing protein RimM
MRDMTTPSTSGWVAIARLLRPQGRKGELLSEPLSDLADIFAAGTAVVLAKAGLAAPPVGAPALHIEDHWFPTGKNAGRVVLKLQGCDSINDAERLAGNELYLSAEALPTLEEGTFFVGDLLGCDFFDGAIRVGTIVDVHFATGPDGRTRLEDAAPLLGIQLSPSPTKPLPTATEEIGDEDEPILVPFVQAWLDSVDIPARRVVMHLPPGLIHSTDDAGDPDDTDIPE